jgi:hypothetical protein
MSLYGTEVKTNDSTSFWYVFDLFCLRPFIQYVSKPHTIFLENEKASSWFRKSTDSHTRWWGAGSCWSSNLWWQCWRYIFTLDWCFLKHIFWNDHIAYRTWCSWTKRIFIVDLCLKRSIYVQGHIAFEK